LGQIHGFTNEFLAVPWLSSKRYKIRMIEDDICLARRWKYLDFRSRLALEKGGHESSVLVVRGSDFNVGDVRWGRGTLGRDKPLYQALSTACKKATEEGFFCFDEMFMWAHDFMDQTPSAMTILRDRFPILFVDEAQDTKEDQAQIIHRIFSDGDKPVTRQRFGDANQAIFGSSEHKGTAAPELAFPDTAIQHDLPTSHRFGPKIASFADPLGIDPCNLQGKGPKSSFTSGATEAQHTIYLFNDPPGAALVLPTFGNLLMDTFSSAELRSGTFKAVGQVHSDSLDDNFPRHIGHYWKDYDPHLSRSEPKPQTMVQYVFAGITKSTPQGESHVAVEKIAEGILHLASLGQNERVIGEPQERRKHRRLLRLLKDHSSELEQYHEFVILFAVDRISLTKDLWLARWKSILQKIGEILAGEFLTNTSAQAFLAWKEGFNDDSKSGGKNFRRENFQRFVREDKEVTIHLGSIHAVKGETHTATLVLETFWHAHNLSSIKDWLIGKRSGGAGAKAREINRLKLHYVAMTRPSHLICIAMTKQGLLSNAKDGGVAILNSLRDRGWRIHEL
jgi:DNA helicase-2/ATP-dependent DNA helicase PcrA